MINENTKYFNALQFNCICVYYFKPNFNKWCELRNRFHEKNYFYNLNLGLNLSVTPQIKENSFDSTLEYFDSKNVNLFLNPITATSWENILPMINLSLQIRNEDWLEFEIKLHSEKMPKLGIVIKILQTYLLLPVK